MSLPTANQMHDDGFQSHDSEKKSTSDYGVMLMNKKNTKLNNCILVEKTFTRQLGFHNAKLLLLL